MLKKLAVGAAALVATSSAAHAEQLVDSIHFLIPGGAGGGWDGTARGTGEALTGAGIVGSASYENMSGGGGGVAIGHLIENADSMHGTLMVNSTPIVIRSLQGVFPYNFSDLTMIAGTIGDFGALVVTPGSATTLADLVAAYNADSSSIAMGGGSVPGGMDHLIGAMVMNAAGADATKIAYLPFDAGGVALAALLSGEIEVLSTGLGEALAQSKAGEVDILCITSDARVADAPDVPTCSEAGADGAYFVNWRGFFAAPGLPDDKADAYRAAIAAMYATPEWEAVRARNGWVEIHNPGADFVSFLENQEQIIGDLMTSMGFL
ncbi:MAG: tripartite tricarboxylate transporter substrate binding protein [Alphaproteobacteria bacterium TMED89]|nr:tripartite tricarboxylate transporter substrate-binding protein [Rhodospirillaceae bacterium]RPH16503.1 MAG: tripartite tricarboxylate transporter substrate binding protein [Alphaproteobacteria bacterium TMED89]